MPFYELLVYTVNPVALDEAIQTLGGVVGTNEFGGYDHVDTDIYRVRVVNPGALGLVALAIDQQGWGEVLAKQEIDKPG